MRALTFAPFAIIFLMTSMLSNVPGGNRPRRAEADVRPPDADRLVQRIPAGAREIRIGAAIEQQVGDLPVGIRRRHDQRALAVGQGIVDIGAGIEQRGTASSAPARTANSSGVKPVGGAARKVLPDSDVRPASLAACWCARSCRRRLRPTPVPPRRCHAAAAHISAVCPRDASLALTLAPPAISA